MSRNNSGFTMIELLAAVVVLGILMGIAIPTVVSVMNDKRNDTYIEDAIRLASTMEYKMNSDNKILVPARGGCIAMSLSYMDNNTFEEGPYGGEYDRDASFVLAYRNASGDEEEYKYYVRLIEKTKTGSYRGVNLVDTNSLYDDKARDKYISNLGAADVFYLSAEKDSDNRISWLTMLGLTGVRCDGSFGGVTIYTPD